MQPLELALAQRQVQTLEEMTKRTAGGYHAMYAELQVTLCALLKEDFDMIKTPTTGAVRSAVWVAFPGRGGQEPLEQIPRICLRSQEGLIAAVDRPDRQVLQVHVLAQDKDLTERVTAFYRLTAVWMMREASPSFAAGGAPEIPLPPPPEAFKTLPVCHHQFYTRMLLKICILCEAVSSCRIRKPCKPNSLQERGLSTHDCRRRRTSSQTSTTSY